MPRQFGSYHVVSRLGRGGMGEVFRAHDPRLGRDVAIKTLPPEFATDPERVARFQREARTLAALNHANIAAIYELDESADSSYLVMELVGGGTLADRIAGGNALPEDVALPISVQVAAALDAAHQKGIVHRDLKPANIGLTTEGTVKVLDFGLAKVTSRSAFAQGATTTDAGSLTDGGAVVGTLPYMSPEQLQGRPVDERSDVWAFGAILYEILTGRRLFDGASSAEVVAAVLTKPIDVEGVPANVRPLLAGCLERDPARRLRHIGDIGLQLSSAPTAIHRGAPRTVRWWWPSVAVTVTLIAITAGWVAPRWARRAPTPITRLEVVEPSGVRFTDRFSVSPDGQRLAFIARVQDRQELWVRSLESFDSRSLVSEGIDGSTPIWSPDRSAIAYWHRDALLRVDAGGGSPQTIAKSPQPGSGFWTPQDLIVFSQRAEGLMQVSVRSGETRVLTTLSPGEILHRSPHPLPGGTHFLYARLTGVDQGRIHVGAVDTAADQQDLTPVLSDATAAAFVPPRDGRPGYLLFLRGARLFAQRFDPSSRALSGDPSLLAEHVGDRSLPALGGGTFLLPAFSVSSTGVLAYRSELKAADQLTMLDRKGTIVDRFGEPALHGNVSIAPDQNHVAAVRRDTEQADIYIYELSGARRRTRFTFNPIASGPPLWSPDGHRIAYAAEREAGRRDLYIKGALDAGGAEQLVYRAPEAPGVQPTSWSPDGRYILLWATLGAERPRNDVLLVTVAERSARTLIARAGFATFSPDGRWVAYWTNKSGRGEIYVRRFDPSGEAVNPPEWTVSNGARSVRPLWRGNEIFYRTTGEQHVASVRITVDEVRRHVSAGVPELLFPIEPGILSWDLTKNGERFLLPLPATEAHATAFKVVLNWEAMVDQQP